MIFRRQSGRSGVQTGPGKCPATEPRTTPICAFGSARAARKSSLS